MFKSNTEVSTKSIFGHYREGKTFLRHEENPDIANKIVDNQLYFLKPRAVLKTSAIVDDLNKLIVSQKLRKEALCKSHDDSQSGYLDIKKTHYKLSIAYY
ncbi:hypothetical protein ALC53_01411 [Atta colombica]|uniref:Uncharacterized protein n=1 Tax=Atta colombica TaxID=520822 RepID=A0A195BTS9_9HYME|nr:hypothetical protein ALC53_01411 [Atta colombica]